MALLQEYELTSAACKFQDQSRVCKTKGSVFVSPEREFCFDVVLFNLV